MGCIGNCHSKNTNVYESVSFVDFKVVLYCIKWVNINIFFNKQKSKISKKKKGKSIG
jgi:hypothetical protein